MFNELTGLGYGLVSFAVLIGVGTVMLVKFGTGVGGLANDTVMYLVDQLGENGLAGWTGAIIAFSIGMLFLGAFFIQKGGRKY